MELGDTIFFLAVAFGHELVHFVYFFLKLFSSRLKLESQHHELRLLETHEQGTDGGLMKLMSFVQWDVLHENPLFDMNLVGLHEIHEGGPVELHENPEDNHRRTSAKP